ncbi:hypothetical protein F750_0317 [Streptomyces sp. PAMC 26508]|nr:hypothetical protein F750_0317 [Streptomyces sp. PAMC 26508]
MQIGERIERHAVSAYGLFSPVAYGRTSPVLIAGGSGAAEISVEIDAPEKGHSRDEPQNIV